MNVENRKLFANRDARRRLSEMGGIMASSPELLGEAQLYANGGRVGGVSVDVYGVPFTVMPDGTVISEVNGQPLDPNNPSFSALIEMAQAAATQQAMPTMGERTGVDIGAGLATGLGDATPSYSLVDIPVPGAVASGDIPMPMNAMEELYASGAMDNNLTYLPGQYGPPRRTYPRVPQSGVERGKTAMTYDELVQAARSGIAVTEGDLVASVEAGLLNSQQAADVAAMIESGYIPTLQDQGVANLGTERPMPEALTDPDAQPRSVMEGVGDYMAGVLGGRTAGEQAAIDDTRKAARAGSIPQSFENEAAAEEPRVLSPEKPEGNLLGDVEGAATDPNRTTDERNGDVSTTILSGLGIGGAGDMSVKDRVSAYESLFKEMLGEKDADLQKEMWMNMAMIGFAIAAGESPNALQNIAQGLLQGTNMMREDKATRQAREDKIRMLAISEGLTDQRAREKFGQDLQLAQIRAKGTGKDVGVPPHPLTYFKDIDPLLSPEERIAEENRILAYYSLEQIQEWAPQFLDRWKSIMGPETGAIENGMKYIGPSYNREAAGKKENWVKVE